MTVHTPYIKSSPKDDIAWLSVYCTNLDWEEMPLLALFARSRTSTTDVVAQPG